MIAGGIADIYLISNTKQEYVQTVPIVCDNKDIRTIFTDNLS